MSDVVEELIRWFRQTEVATPFGEIGIVITKHEGQTISVKRIYNETHRLQPKPRATQDQSR